MTTTTQAEFHPMRGHMDDGCIIKMENGDVLTLRAGMRGWQLFKGDKAIGVATANAHILTRSVIEYGRAA